jgi:hypothetical protein
MSLPTTGDQTPPAAVPGSTPTPRAMGRAGGSSCAAATARRRPSGFTSQRAAAGARRRLVEQVERREVVHTTETFGRYFARDVSRQGWGAVIGKPYDSVCSAPAIRLPRLPRIGTPALLETERVGRSVLPAFAMRDRRSGTSSRN